MKVRRNAPPRAEREIDPSGPTERSKGSVPSARRRFALGAAAVHRARQGLAVAFVGLLVFSGYGAMAPANVRCQLPGAVGCPGGWLGAPLPAANATNELFFNVTMYDYGFWIVNTATGVNNTKTWTVYEGWTVHINATSLPADASVSGTAYHGIGIELNATGKQLLTVNAPVGRWVTGQFTAPTSAYYHQHIWCTIECGPGHGGMQLHNLNIVPATTIPQASASATPTSGAAPLTVALTGSNSGGTAPFSYSWDFGDGSAAATTRDANHTYTLSGSYSATFTVTDANSNHASASVAISVTTTTPLSVAVSASPTSGTAPVAVGLSATATGGVGPYSYAWTLGDGTVATGASVAHLYSAPGLYGPVLTVTDSSGASASGSASITVLGATGSFPVSAAATPSSGAAPLPVTLTATPQGGSGPYTTTWVFGDGSFGSGASLAHTYAVNGRYTATVYVADASGRVGVNTTSVSVSGASGAPLRLFLSESPSSGSPPLPIAASVSIVGGTEPYGVPSWSFGDGGTASGISVAHTFATLGLFNVSVSVADNTGTTASATTPVRTSGLLMSITLTPTTGDAPFTVTGDASIVGGDGRYNPVAWSWGDGSQSTGAPANHTYAASVVGSVTVSASVSDGAGATANASATVVISPPPRANLTSNLSSNALPPVDVNFTLAVSGGTGVYSTSPLWDFGDGSTTRGPSPRNHTYERPGHYLVTVSTNDSLGTVANASLWVNISGGAATSGGGGAGGGAQWGFTGVSDPDTAALALLGVMALSGLVLLYRGRLRRAKAAASKAGTAAAGVGRAPSTGVASAPGSSSPYRPRSPKD